MREQHLDLLAVFARLLVRLGLGNLASDIPRRFMDAASDLAHRCVRTAARLQRAICTIGLAGSINDRASLGDVGPQVLERAPLLLGPRPLWSLALFSMTVPLIDWLLPGRRYQWSRPAVGSDQDGRQGTLGRTVPRALGVAR